jgi:uncharacterized membrane-anchored protein YhcB (DUF1043 family)
MNDRDNAEIWTAVTVGLLVGVGTALIVRARQEDEVHDIVRRVRRVRPRAEKTVKKARRALDRHADQAADAGEELVKAGRTLLDELKEDAAAIVRRSRRELERMAREAVVRAVEPEPEPDEGALRRAWKRTRQARA